MFSLPENLLDQNRRRQNLIAPLVVEAAQRRPLFGFALDQHTQQLLKRLPLEACAPFPTVAKLGTHGGEVLNRAACPDQPHRLEPLHVFKNRPELRIVVREQRLKLLCLHRI